MGSACHGWFIVKLMSLLERILMPSPFLDHHSLYIWSGMSFWMWWGWSWQTLTLTRDFYANGEILHTVPALFNVQLINLEIINFHPNIQTLVTHWLNKKGLMNLTNFVSNLKADFKFNLDIWTSNVIKCAWSSKLMYGIKPCKHFCFIHFKLPYNNCTYLWATVWCFYPCIRCLMIKSG